MGIKILLADDSVTAQNMGKKILSEAGHQVVTVSNGAAAAKKIAEIKPNLVLLDVFMPGYSGLEICEKLRASAETAKLPVLLTVGRMEPYNPADGARVKADGIIVKPFEASDLIAAVERLAEKAAAAKAQEIPEHERTMKIAPPKESKRDSKGYSSEVRADRPSFDTAKEPPKYEQTMRLDAAQIAAMLNSAKQQTPAAEPPPSGREEFDVPGPQTAEEFHVPVASIDAGLPAFADDLEAAAPKSGFPAQDTQTSTVASYMEQYLGEAAPVIESAAPAFEPAMPESTESALSLEAAMSSSAFDSLAPTIGLSHDLLPHSFKPDTPTDTPVASAEGLELTAAAPVRDLPVAQAPGFEATLQSAETATILKDPAFVSDPHSATIDFPTQFGLSEQPVSPEFAAHAEPSAPVDDFEARLNAVMASSFEDPSTDLPFAFPPAASEMVAEAAPTPVAELQPEPAESWQTPAQEVEASAEVAQVQIEAPAASDQPAVAATEAVAEVSATEFSLSGGESLGEAQLAEEKVAVDAVSTTAIERAEPATISKEARVSPDPDESVIQQMRESISHPGDSLHVVESSHVADSYEPAPLAMAAAAAVSPASASLGRETELGIVRGVTAVVSGEVTTGTGDANNIASAVEKVMQRELPSLIWKIMAELDLRKR